MNYKINFFLIIAFIINSNFIIISEDKMNIESRINFKITIQDNKSDKMTRINIKDFGAKGDGKTNDTKAVQSAVNSVKDNTVLIFPKGIYIIKKTIVINKSNIALQGEEATIIFKPENKEKINFTGIKNGKLSSYNLPPSVFLVEGEVYNKNLSNDIDLSSNTKIIKFKTDSSNLKKNDAILIASSDHGKAISRKNETLKFYREQNFITTINDISENEITLKEPTSIAMKDIKLYKINPVKNVSINGFTIKGIDNKIDFSGIYFAWAINSFVYNNNIYGASKAFISLYQCYKCEISNNNLYDALKFGSAEGYGIALDRSHFCIIGNNHTKNHRHGIILDHGNSNCIIEKNKVETCSTRASIDLHGEYNYFNVIRNNSIKNGKTGIIVGGGGDVHYNDGPYNCITENEISDCNNGIEVNNESGPTIIGKNDFKEIKKENIVLSNTDKQNLIYFNE